MTPVTDAEIASWLRVIEDGTRAYMEDIRAITSMGDIACVVYFLNKTDSDMAWNLGYDGFSPVFRLSNKLRKQYVGHFREKGAKYLSEWLSRKATNRILFIVDETPHPLNVTPEGIDFEVNIMGFSLLEKPKASDFMTKLLDGLK